MSGKQARERFRRDYRRPDFLVEEVDLRFQLEPTATLVHATLRMRRGEEAHGAFLPAARQRGAGDDVEHMKLDGVDACVAQRSGSLLPVGIRLSG